MVLIRDISDKQFWILAIIAIILVMVYSSLRLNRIDTFAVGKVEEIYKNSKGSRYLDFSFSTIDGKEHRAYLKNPTITVDENNLIGEEYIVGYYSKLPSSNYIFLEFPARNVSLDSLNNVTSPRSFLSFWELVSQ